MFAFLLPAGGTLVLGTAGQPDTLIGTGGNDMLFGFEAGDNLIGGQGNDMMFGGAGADSFSFAHAETPGQVDFVLDFHSGEDLISLVNISPKEVTLHDTDQGMEVWYGGLGGIGVNHGVVVLWAVHQVQPNDFAFVSA